MHHMYVYVLVRYSLLDDTECRGPVYSLYSSYYEYSQYFACWYTVYCCTPESTVNTAVGGCVGA